MMKTVIVVCEATEYLPFEIPMERFGSQKIFILFYARTKINIRIRPFSKNVVQLLISIFYL